MSLTYILSPGCILTDEECAYFNDYNRDLIKLTYNPYQIDANDFIYIYTS